MRTILADILIPLCTMLVAAATAAELTKKTAPTVSSGWFPARIFGKLNGNALAFTAVGITTALQLVFFLISDAVISACSVSDAGGTGMDFAAMLLVSALGFAALLFALYQGSAQRLRRCVQRTAIAAVVLLFAECFLFGAKSLTVDPESKRISLFTLGDHAASAEGDTIQLSADNAFIECVPSKGTRAVSIRMEKADVNRMIQVTSYIKDDNFSRTYQQTDQRYVAGNGETFTLNLDPYGELYSLKLHFGNIGEPITVYEVIESSAQPFQFMTTRFLLLLLLIAAVITVREFELHRVVYDPAKRKHRTVLAMISAVCICSPLLLASPQNLIEYDLSKDVSGEDVFIKTFDALQHGQAHLRMDVSPELAALTESEVYDNSLRTEKGIPYAWDHAFKDGKYYSYFGITPIVTLYYPMYWLTHQLPTLRWAIMFYAVLAAAFTCLAVISGVTLLVKKPNFLMLCLSLPASVLTAGIFYTVQYFGIYVLPLVSAICFLMLSLWQGFTACRTETKWKMYAHFACSGLALGLCAGARPSIAISAAILIPLFLGILMNREEKWKQKLLKAGAFAVPLFAVVAGLLVYNQARFGSFTDFGAQYQLTVSNINANQIRLYAIPEGIYHYMLQPPDIKGTFPFVGFSWQGFANYERYRFTYPNVGILWVPMLALASLLLRTVCSGGYAKTPYQSVTALQKKAVLLTGFATACIVSWMDFCLAGNGAQYIFDIAPVLCICAAIILVTAAKPENELRYRVMWISCICSALMFVLILIGLRDGPIHENYPLLYQNAESMFVFWH